MNVGQVRCGIQATVNALTAIHGQRARGDLKIHTREDLIEEFLRDAHRSISGEKVKEDRRDKNEAESNIYHALKLFRHAQQHGLLATHEDEIERIIERLHTALRALDRMR